jgi:hypothetical protein
MCRVTLLKILSGTQQGHRISYATLTVESGVEVQVGPYSLQVGSATNGYLFADGATFNAGSGYIRLTRGTLTMTSCLVQGSSGTYGLWLDGVSSAQASVVGCTISGVSGAYGIKLADLQASVTGCVLSGFDYPYQVESGDLTLSGNDISGCVNQVVAVFGNCQANTPWRASWGLPVVMIGSVTVFMRR